jgi:hypothetical protein
MFRFTIRDVLWLTVVVGMALGWGITASDIAKSKQADASLYQEIQAIDRALTRLESRVNSMERRVWPMPIPSQVPAVIPIPAGTPIIPTIDPGSTDNRP